MKKCNTSFVSFLFQSYVERKFPKNRKININAYMLFWACHFISHPCFLNTSDIMATLFSKLKTGIHQTFLWVKWRLTLVSDFSQSVLAIVVYLVFIAILRGLSTTLALQESQHGNQMGNYLSQNLPWILILVQFPKKI